MHDGKLVIEADYYKAILTIDPKKTGAPVRLRLIVNIQSIIQHDLFNIYPEKKEIYELHTWLDGSELNFIMPEDYEFYYNKEQSICDIIEFTARNLFFELISEHLKTSVQNPEDLILYVSQWEVCWEEEFTQRNTDDPEFKTYPCPGLAKYLDNMVHKYHRFVKSYANYKFEAESGRPSFYCDLPSMDPQTPMMQYKTYPKFRNTENNIMIRREIIPTRFFKEFGKDSPDSLPLAAKVLSNPAYCRETVERLLQLELELNGVEGLGYNEAFRKPTKDEIKEFYNKLNRHAIFGNKAEKYKNEYNEFLETGIISPNIPIHYRKKFFELGICEKVPDQDIETDDIDNGREGL